MKVDVMNGETVVFKPESAEDPGTREREEAGDEMDLAWRLGCSCRRPLLSRP